MEGGRGEPKPGGAGAPHGARMLSPTAVRGLAGPPQPCPTAPGATRRPGGGTTSSSSAARAEEPSTPLGLGERRFGEPEPDPGASPLGLAMGAIGLATGPGSGMDARLLGPDGSIEGVEVTGVLGGGPIGVAGDSPRLYPGSNGGPAPKFRGRAEGASVGGGPCCIEGPGPKPYGDAVKGALGDMVDGGSIPGPCVYNGFGGGN